MPLTKVDFDNAAMAWGKTMQVRAQAEIDYAAAAKALQAARDQEETMFAAFMDVVANLPPGTI